MISINYGKADLQQREMGWKKVAGSYRVKSKAFKVLWIVVVAILVLIVALVILFHISLLMEYPVYRYVTTLLLALVGIAFYLTYSRRHYETHQKQSRIVFVVCFSLANSFLISGVVVALLGRPLPSPYSFLLFLALIGVGAYIGDELGRKLRLY